MTKRDKILSIISGVALTATITTAGVAAAGLLTPQLQAEIDISSAVSDGLAKISDATKNGVEEIMGTADETKNSAGTVAQEPSRNETSSQSNIITASGIPIIIYPSSSAPEEISFRQFDLTGRSLSANGIIIRFQKAEVNYKDGTVSVWFSIENGSLSSYYYYGKDGFSAVDADGNNVSVGKYNQDAVVMKGDGNKIATMVGLWTPGADLTRVTLTYDFAQHGGTSSMTPNPQTITFDFPKE